eukprot:6213942-Pleurochrysis_carterae.AAC.2
MKQDIFLSRAVTVHIYKLICDQQTVKTHVLAQTGIAAVYLRVRNWTENAVKRLSAVLTRKREGIKRCGCESLWAGRAAP